MSQQRRQETLEHYERLARQAGYASLRDALKATLHDTRRAAAQHLGFSRGAIPRLRSQFDLAHPKPRATPQQRNDAVAAVIAGEDPDTVAKRIGMRTDRLYYWVSKLHPDWQRQPTPHDNGHAVGTLRARTRTNDQRRKAVAEVKAGHSFAEVARRYGVADTTVHNWWKRFG